MDELVADWTADPVFTLTGLKKVLHWSKGTANRSDVPDWNVTGAEKAIHSGTASTALQLSIPLDFLPVGAIIQSVVGRINLVNAANPPIIQIDLERIDSTPALTAIATATANGTGSTGWQDLSLSSIAHTVLADQVYILDITITPDGTTKNARLLFITVTYDLTHAVDR